MILKLENNPEEIFNIVIFGYLYQFRQLWNTKGFWTLDISQSDGTVLIHGVKIIAGAYLLSQYPHIRFDLKNNDTIDPKRFTLDSFTIEIINKDV